MLADGPVDVHEARTRASEIKFLVEAAVAERVRAWARLNLQPDPHGAGRHGDEYHTETIYFDSADLRVLHRVGSYGRAKFRVRRYGAGDRAFLERKLRRGQLLVKRRTLVPLEALARLEGASGAASWEGVWFERRMRLRALSPVCQMRYRRTARLAATDAGPARLTIDTDVTAMPAPRPVFSDGAGVRLLAGQEILEMKFRDALPPVFARLVHEFGLIPQTASKYRLGMAALGHAVPAADRGLTDRLGARV